MAYAGIDLPELVRRTQIKPGTLRNVISKSRPSGGTEQRLLAIAHACGVPPWFMEHGFAPPVETGEADLRERVERLERELAAGVGSQEDDLDQRLAADGIAIFDEHDPTQTADRSARSDRPKSPTPEPEAAHHEQPAPAGAQS